MDLTTLLIGLFTLALFVVPFVIISRKSKSKGDQAS